MTLTLYTIAGLALSLGMVFLTTRWARHGQLSFLRLGFFAGGATLLLLLFWMISAMLYRGSTFGRIQLLAWTVFMHLPLFLLGSGLCLWRRWRAGSGVMVGLAGILGLIAVSAFVIEPQWLEVSTVTLHSAKLAEPLRVVVLADIQTDAPGRYEALVLEQAMVRKPDLILFAGDYIQLGRRSSGYETEADALRALLEQARIGAPLGVYAIAGNVDPPGIWPRVFTGLLVMVIETTTRHDLGPVVVTGLGMEDSFGLHLSLDTEAKFHIVLGHSPNFSLAPVEADLLIAGHTHGGQVALPFLGPLLTLTQVPRSWASGVTQIAAGNTLVVSRGIGVERADAPRLRFLCRPELVVIDLLPAQ